MKIKTTKYMAVLSAAAVVALVGTVARPVFAADGDVYKLSDKSVAKLHATYNGNLTEMNKLNLMTASNPANFGYEKGGVVYGLDSVFQKFNAAAAAGAVDPASTMTVGATKVGDASEFNASLTVVSVSAINAKTIEVKFNNAIDATDGIDGTKFSLMPTIAVGATATLSEDAKTVTLALATAMSNDQAYTVTVDHTLKGADGVAIGTTAADDFKKSLTFADTVKPTIVGTSITEAGTLKVSFSEALSVKPTLVINNTAIAAGNVTLVAGADSVTAVLPAGLVAGTSYSIIAQSAVDLASNSMVFYQGSFVYNVTADAPVVKSVVAKDETNLTIEFSEPLSAAITSTELKVIKGTTELTLGAITDITPVGTSNTKFNVVLPNAVYATDETSAALKVSIKGYKDVAGNFGADALQNVTVTKDVVAPSIVKSEYVVADGEFVITYNENLTAATPAATKFVITDKDGIAYTAVPKANGAKTIILDTTGLTTPGTYNVQIVAGAATDASIALNKTVAATATLTITVADPTPGKPTMTFTQPSKGVILATYNEAVTGGAVAGSATDLANYKLNGVALPIGTTIYLNTGKTVATITLPSNSVAKSQSYTLSASNVKDSVGNVMVDTTQVVSLLDNTTPKLLTAVYQADGTILLTFSENVNLDATPTMNANDEDNFAITLVGNVLANDDYTIAVGDTAKELVVTSASGVSFATGTITIKTADTTSIDDADSNLLESAITLTVR